MKTKLKLHPDDAKFFVSRIVSSKEGCFKAFKSAYYLDLKSCRMNVKTGNVDDIVKRMIDKNYRKFLYNKLSKFAKEMDILVR